MSTKPQHVTDASVVNRIMNGPPDEQGQRLPPSSNSEQAAPDGGQTPTLGMPGAAVATSPVDHKAEEPSSVPAQRERPLITACILARNEAGRIEGAIDCLQGWTDEIIVIDNESEDATAEIAARLGARVLTAPR